VAQRAKANGQRVRKRQPEGGAIGEGGSPWTGTVVGRSGLRDGAALSSMRV
jgi:hypothetical protein